jgi:hypothetical protein
MMGYARLVDRMALHATVSTNASISDHDMKGIPCVLPGLEPMFGSVRLKHFANQKLP